MCKMPDFLRVSPVYLSVARTGVSYRIFSVFSCIMLNTITAAIQQGLADAQAQGAFGNIGQMGQNVQQGTDSQVGGALSGPAGHSHNHPLSPSPPQYMSLALGQQKPVFHVKPLEKQDFHIPGPKLQGKQNGQHETDSVSVISSRSSQSSRSELEGDEFIVKNAEDLSVFLRDASVKEWDQSTVRYKCHGLFLSPFRSTVNYTGLEDKQEKVLSQYRRDEVPLISLIAQTLEFGDWAWKEASLEPYKFTQYEPRFSAELKDFFLYHFFGLNGDAFNERFHPLVEKAGSKKPAYECIDLGWVLRFVELDIRTRVGPERQINIGMYNHLRSTGALVRNPQTGESIAGLVSRHMTVGEATQLCQAHHLYAFILPFRFELS